MLYEAVNDSLNGPAMAAFFDQEKAFLVEQLLTAVRLKDRDTMKEARFAGMIQAYEECLDNLKRFAKEQLQEASQ